MTNDQAIELVAGLVAAYQHVRVEPETVAIYVEDVRELDYGLARRAIEAVRRESEYFPTIAAIRKQAALLDLNAPSLAVAFAQALNQDASSRHPLVARARRLTGDSWSWRETPERDLWFRFKQAYEDTIATATREHLATGHSEYSPQAAVAEGERPQLRALPSPAVCPECETGGGLHTDDCPYVKKATL